VLVQWPINFHKVSDSAGTYVMTSNPMPQAIRNGLHSRNTALAGTLAIDAQKKRAYEPGKRRASLADITRSGMRALPAFMLILLILGLLRFGVASAAHPDIGRRTRLTASHSR
jgi:hypothetical protein